MQGGAVTRQVTQVACANRSCGEQHGGSNPDVLEDGRDRERHRYRKVLISRLRREQRPTSGARVTDIRDLAYGSLDAFAKALDTSIEDVSFAGPAQEYAALILTRLKATFEAIALLLKNGHLDEAVVLTRRQTEDSLRLHYMYVHRDLSDGLALDLVRWREELVLKPMDRIINDETLSIGLRNRVKPMAISRRKRIAEHRRRATESGVELQRFPELHEIASDLDRHADMIVYASAAEVSHSALSAVTAAYMTQDSPGRAVTVDETSDRPAELAAFARSAINSTGIAVIFAMKILGRDQAASRIANVGSVLQQKLQKAEQKQP